MRSGSFSIRLILIATWVAMPGLAHAVSAPTSSPISSVPATAANIAPVLLWQEDMYWDGLISERTHSRAERQSADPNLIPVLQSIAEQMYQQALNLQQVETYTKAQQENLQYAFSEATPEESLATIDANLETLNEGMDQIRSNVFYLAARCRMASTQALPDPNLTKTAATLIQTIQASQLQLNSLYQDAAKVQDKIKSRVKSKKNLLRYRSDTLVHSILYTQDSVFAIYNASYEIYVLSKK